MKNRTIIIGAVVVAVVLGAAAVGVAYLATSAHPSPDRSAVVGPPSPTAELPTSASPSASGTSVVDRMNGSRFATTIAGLFCRPNLDQQVWFHALTPYLSEDAANGFSTTDPGNVPCSRITGPAQAVGDEQTSLAQAYLFPTDGPTITVSIDRNTANEPWEAGAILINN